MGEAETDGWAITNSLHREQPNASPNLPIFIKKTDTCLGTHRAVDCGQIVSPRSNCSASPRHHEGFSRTYMP
jgi:hypothetical protein